MTTDTPTKVIALAAIGVFAFMTVVLGMAIRMTIWTTHYFPSESMGRTMPPGSRILVDRTAYWSASPARGEIVLHHAAEEERFEDLPLRKFVHRVVAVGGDTVMCCQDGRIVRNGEPLDEPYVPESQEEFARLVVRDGHLFLLGDNRNSSHDSRQLGTVPASLVLGRVEANGVEAVLGAFVLGAAASAFLTNATGILLLRRMRTSGA